MQVIFVIYIFFNLIRNSTVVRLLYRFSDKHSLSIQVHSKTLRTRKRCAEFKSKTLVNIGYLFLRVISIKLT